MDACEAEKKAREYLNYISNEFGGCITKADLEEECLHRDCWEITYNEAGKKIKVTVSNKSGKVTEIDELNKQEKLN